MELKDKISINTDNIARNLILTIFCVIVLIVLIIWIGTNYERIQTLEEKTENLPQRYCYNETELEIIEIEQRFNFENNSFYGCGLQLVPEGIEDIVCEEGILFSKYNTKLMKNCGNETKICTIIRKKEVCEIR